MNADLENKPSPSEVEGLIAACRDGDCYAYASLAGAYSGRVFAICYGILSSPEDAEDVARQTLLKGFVNIRQIRRNDSYGSWISRIARKLSVDFAHRRRRRRDIHAEALGADPQGSQDYLKLREVLDELSEEYRVALMLYYFDGRNAKAVAEALETSEDAAVARLSQARRQLRKLLQAKGDA